MSKNNHPCQRCKEIAPRGPKVTETVTIPLKDYRNMLRACTAFDIIVNSADSYGVDRATFNAVCNSMGVTFAEGKDA